MGILTIWNPIALVMLLVSFVVAGSILLITEVEKCVNTVKVNMEMIT